MTWGAVATIAGSAVANKSAGDAAKKAAGDQADVAREGAAATDKRFGQTREDLAPFREAGVQALTQQQALLGLSGQDAQQGAFDAIQESPGQAFIRQRQQRALLQNSAAIGGLGGGNVRGALQQQAAGFAQQDINNQFNRLSSLAGNGQTATTNVGQFGQSATANAANARNQAAQAGASGILGAEQARQRFIGDTSRSFGQFFGRRS